MTFLTNAWNTTLVVTSLVLLAYWFRYTCLFILRSSSARTYAGRVAAANRLNFTVVQAELNRAEAIAEPDRLRELLDRDYRLISYLIAHGSEFRSAGRMVERWVLHIDFKMMRVSYTLSRWAGYSQARKALGEMADIISHLANSMGKESSLATSR